MVAVDNKVLTVEVEIVIERQGEGFRAYCPKLSIEVAAATEQDALRLAREAAEAHFDSLLSLDETAADEAQEDDLEFAVPSSQAASIGQAGLLERLRRGQQSRHVVVIELA